MALIYDVSFDSQTRVLSLLDKAGNVISSCEVPSKRDPLTLTATADNSSVELIKNGELSNAYEVDTGNGWTAYTFGTVINLNSGESCRWRCSAHPTTQSPENYVQFEMTGTIEASGNVNSMLSSNFEGITSLAEYDSAFYGLFRDCVSLMAAPQLPATILAGYCYQCMFLDCRALTIAPALPATALAEGCYKSMFKGCEALESAPQVPAKTVAQYCYCYMFSECKALMVAPDLPATSLAYCCYYYMFNGCTSLNEVRIAATKTASEALYRWLENVASSGTVYANPNFKGLPTNSVSGIPSGWTRRNIADYPATP